MAKMNGVGSVLVSMLAVGASVVHADAVKTPKIVGVLTSVEANAMPTMQVKTRSGETKDVQTDGKTRFAMWGAPQLGQRFADRRALVVGRCVEIELRGGDVAVAKFVRVGRKPSTASEVCTEFR